MHQLTLNETQLISGGTLSDNLTKAGGLVGALYGAGAGAAIAIPFAGIGLVFALTSQPIIWYGVYASCGILAAGTIGGALVGGLLGGTVVALGTQVVNSIYGALPA
ncbi:MAG: hypothetical protein JSS07_01525 [Proteobacteria bacterium]|nr:hypothetical protein [Pseudomonadota bacterium]